MAMEGVPFLKNWRQRSGRATSYSLVLMRLRFSFRACEWLVVLLQARTPCSGCGGRAKTTKENAHSVFGSWPRSLPEQCRVWIIKVFA